MPPQEAPMSQDEPIARPHIRWSIRSYQMAAQAVIAELLRQQGMTFHVDGRLEIHWGHTIAPVCTITAMVGVEALLLNQQDWDTLWGRLQREALYLLPYMRGPVPVEQLMHRLYDRTYEQIAQPDTWLLIEAAAEYYEDAPRCTSEKLRRFVKRRLKAAQEKK